ncbi:MAG TPA: hypothetical protein GX515_12420 [Firmicutes bacterium]|nr:hypothetical protein [Bacillota bacterium]
MWLLAKFEPSGLFTLRSSATTSMGGKTLLVPTMYAVKMALLSAAFASGRDVEALFPTIRGLVIRFLPPRKAVVTHSLVRMLREDRSGKAEFISAPVYREFVYYDGELTIAFSARPSADGRGGPRRTIGVGRSHSEGRIGPAPAAAAAAAAADAADAVGAAGDQCSVSALRSIEDLLPMVNYFGKRASFFQFKGCEWREDLDEAFSFVIEDNRPWLPGDHIIQYLDDMAAAMTLERANAYTDAEVKLGRDRVFVAMAVPYRLVASGHAYTAYERTA